MRTCSNCGERKSPSDFGAWSRQKNGRSYPQSWCKACKAAHAREHRQQNPELARARDRDRYWANPERYRAYAINHGQGLRLKALEKLGGACAWCAEDDPVVLELDHIDGTGWMHGRSRGGVAVKQALAGDPNVQLLCANCHRRKTAMDRQRAESRGEE